MRDEMTAHCNAAGTGDDTIRSQEMCSAKSGVANSLGSAIGEQSNPVVHMGSRPRVCFVSLYCYPLFNPACKSPFGGSEVRVSLLAKELARCETYDICVLVFDHGQADVEQICGVTVVRWDEWVCPLAVTLHPKKADPLILHQPLAVELDVQPQVHLGLFWKGVRFLHRVVRYARDKLISVSVPTTGVPPECITARSVFGIIGSHVVDVSRILGYEKVDADLYVLPGNSDMAAELSLFCKRRGKKYVFLSGSDGDYHPDYKASPKNIGIYGLPGFLMNYAIESADCHVVQTPKQAEMLRQIYGRTSVVIRNPVDLEVKQSAIKEFILWVGKSDWIKRPELILDIARQLPNLNFMIIMTVSNPGVHTKCIQVAKTLYNVQVCEYVPFNEIDAYFARAKVFVNTSRFEGFPNTFLQAGKHGTPVVSLEVDPGGMLSEHGCGVLCHSDLPRMVSVISVLHEKDELRASMSERCISYIAREHDKIKITKQFEVVLSELLRFSNETCPKEKEK